MLVYIDGKPYAALSITGSPVPILEVKEDYMQCVIECPYCGQRTTVGDTIMCSGYVGCSNCYFVPSGLLETVEWYRKNDREKYTNGNFYKKGFIENREDRVLKNDYLEEDIKTENGEKLKQIAMIFYSKQNDE